MSSIALNIPAARAALATGTLSIELHQLARFASTDAIRVSLHYVMIRKQGEGYQAVTTDGHRMAMVTLPAGSVQGPETFYIPASLLLRVKLKKGATAGFTVDADQVRVIVSDGTVLTEATVQYDITYPAVDQVMPREDAEGPHATAWGIDPDYLWDAGDYIRKVTGDKRNGMTVTAPSDALAPMRITSPLVPGYVCIIMPMRI